MKDPVSSYVHQWPELLISSTLSTLVLRNTECGIGFILPSTKFIQCQTVISYTLNAIQSSACSFCSKAETLQQIISSCSVYVEEGRYTWRHNSILLFLANPFHVCPIAQYMSIFLHFYHQASLLETL